MVVDGQSEIRIDSAARLPRRLLFGILLVLAIATSVGAIAPWVCQSAQGIARRERLRGFAEDYQAASRYPVFRACRLVHSTTEHRVDRRIAPWENWIQWTLGQVYEPLERTQRADRILELGYGDCSERVAVIQSLFRSSQLPTRIVGLGGHVVLEVYANQMWYTVDPDYGVVYRGRVDELVQRAPENVAIPLVRAGYSPNVIDEYLRILQSPDDNSAMPLNSPLSPRLHAAEDLASMMLVGLPCVLWLFAGCIWLNRART